MIVLDQSGSMLSNNRWANCVAALKTMASEWESEMRLGLIFFPASNEIASNGCSIGDIEVLPALNQADEIAELLDDENPRGGTPTDGTLLEVHEYMTSDHGLPPGTPQYVLLVTDGSSNCTGPGADGDDPFHAPSQEATRDAVATLFEDGIKTYGIGYDIERRESPSDPLELGDVMDEWAAAGGTGVYRGPRAARG